MWFVGALLRYAYVNLRKHWPFQEVMANMSSEQCGKREPMLRMWGELQVWGNEWFCAFSDFLCVMDLWKTIFFMSFKAKMHNNVVWPVVKSCLRQNTFILGNWRCFGFVRRKQPAGSLLWFFQNNVFYSYAQNFCLPLLIYVPYYQI